MLKLFLEMKRKCVISSLASKKATVDGPIERWLLQDTSGERNPRRFERSHVIGHFGRKTDGVFVIDTMTRYWLEEHDRPPTRLECLKQSREFNLDKYESAPESLRCHIETCVTHAVTTSFTAET